MNQQLQKPPAFLPQTQPRSSALMEPETQRAIAEVQAAMILARQFPRDRIAAVDRIMNACTRPRLAETALYSYARGGTEITGPSIRLAEAIAQEWGNVQFGIRELEQRNGESTVEAFAWDIETNTRQVKVFQVPHTRYSKSKGNTALTDPRDIYELVANQGARRLRACILGIIPGDVVEDAVQQCDATMHSNSPVTPESIKKLLEAFKGHGVSKEQIEARIQRRIDSIQPAQMVQLRKIFASLKDGMSKAEDWFETNLPKDPKPAKTAPKTEKKQEPDPEPQQDPTQAEPEPESQEEAAPQGEAAQPQEELSAEEEWA